MCEALFFLLSACVKCAFVVLRRRLRDVCVRKMIAINICLDSPLHDTLPSLLSSHLRSVSVSSLYYYDLSAREVEKRPTIYIFSVLTTKTC